MKLALLILAAIVGVIVLAVLLMALIGSFLPKDHSATRSVLLHKSPESIYAVARDFESMAKWRTDVRTVNVKTGSLLPQLNHRIAANHRKRMAGTEDHKLTLKYQPSNSKFTAQNLT